MKEIPQEMKFVEPLLREVCETIKQNAMLEMKAARQKELKLFAESAWNPMVKNVKDLTDVVNSLSLKFANVLGELLRPGKSSLRILFIRIWEEISRLFIERSSREMGSLKPKEPPKKDNCMYFDR